MNLVFDEKENRYVLNGEDATMASDDKKASMQASAAGVLGSLEKLSKSQVQGFPVGAIGVGTVGAFVIDKIIIDRLVARETDPQKAATTAMWAEIALAIAIATYGKKKAPTAATAAAFVLGYEAISGKIAAALDKAWPKPSDAAQQQQSDNASQQQIYGGRWVEPSVFRQEPAAARQQNTGGKLGAYEMAF